MTAPALDGWVVVVTRPAGQHEEIVRALSATGAQPLVVPTLAIVDAEDGGAALRAAVARTDIDRIIVTSANGARMLRAAVDAGGREPPPLAVVGPRTAEVARSLGFAVDLVPDTFRAEHLVEVVPEADHRVLIVRPERGRPVLAEGLRARGHDVDEVVAYRSVPAPVDPGSAEAAQRADAVTFTSGLAHLGYVESVGAPAQPVVGSIGPVTTAAIRERGGRVDVEAREATVESLVAALAEFAEGR